MLDHERRDQLAGVGLGVLGVVVLAMAIVALREPDKGTASTVPRTTQAATTQPVSPVLSSSAAPRKHHRKHPAATTSSVSPSDVPSGVASSGPSAATASAAKQPLIIMNNTSTTGLAAGAMARFESGGWTVTHIGTLQQNIASTCAYYDPNQSGAKEAALALQAQYPDIKRVKPRFAGLPDGPIVVVLTWDYKPAG